VVTGFCLTEYASVDVDGFCINRIGVSVCFIKDEGCICNAYVLGLLIGGLLVIVASTGIREPTSTKSMLI